MTFFHHISVCLLLLLLYPCSDTPCFQFCIRTIQSCFIRTSRTCSCFDRIFISLLSHFRAWNIVLEFGLGESSHSTSVFTNRICGSQITWGKTIVAGSPERRPSRITFWHFRAWKGTFTEFSIYIRFRGYGHWRGCYSFGPCFRCCLHSRSGLSISSLLFCSPWGTDRSHSIFICSHLRSTPILRVLDSPYVCRSNYL